MQQGAYDDIDTYCSIEKQYKMLSLFHYYYDTLKKLVDKGVLFDNLKKLKVNDELYKLKSTIKNSELHLIDEVKKRLDEETSKL